MQRQADRDKIAEEAVGQRHESAPPYAARNEEVSQEEAARHLAGSARAQATTPEKTAESVGERVGNAYSHPKKRGAGFLLVIWYSSMPTGWDVRIVPMAESEVFRWTARHAAFWNYTVIAYRFIEGGQKMTISINPVMSYVLLALLYNFVADFAALPLTRRILEQLEEAHHPKLRHLIIVVIGSAVLLLTLSLVFLMNL